MNTRPAAKATPDERVRAQHALERRMAGQNWQTIADELGYADRSGPHRAVDRLLAKVDHEDASEFRDIEGARLDALLKTYWPKATSGDLKAAEFVLKVIAQRSRLFGLDMPTKVTLSTSVSDAEFAEQAAALIAEIASGPTPAITAAEPRANPYLPRC